MCLIITPYYLLQQVSGFEPSTTKDTLEYYFENKRRSSCGPVEDVTFNKQEGYALVTFKNKAGNEILPFTHFVMNSLFI